MAERLKVNIKYHDGSVKIEEIEVGDWYDLAIPYEVTFEPFEFKLVPLNISMELPEGYEALITPRSSTYKKWRLLQTNHLGVIDNSYNGDGDIWHLPLLNIPHKGIWDTDGESVTIPKGTRLCQFRLMKKSERIEFVEKDTLGNDDRGGFGSTGS